MVPIHAHIFLRSRGVNCDIRRYREPLAVANIGWSRPSRTQAFPWGIEDRSCSGRLYWAKEYCLGTQAKRFTPWMDHFNRVEDESIRRVAFVAYWLSKCVFGEHPPYSIKPLYFPLDVMIAVGACFPFVGWCILSHSCHSLQFIHYAYVPLGVCFGVYYKG